LNGHRCFLFDETVSDEHVLNFFSHYSTVAIFVSSPVVPEQRDTDNTCDGDPCDLQNLIQSQMVVAFSIILLGTPRTGRPQAEPPG